MNCKLTSEWKLVDIANESQLEDYDRIRKKHKKIKQYAREAARDMDMSTYCESDINTLREAVSDLQKRERELQQKVQELHAKLQEANRKPEEAMSFKEVAPQRIQLSDVSMKYYEILCTHNVHSMYGIWHNWCIRRQDVCL